MPNIVQTGVFECGVFFPNGRREGLVGKFQETLRSLSESLDQAGEGTGRAITASDGTPGIKSVANLFAKSRKILVLRDGSVAVRWSSVFDIGRLAAESTAVADQASGGQPSKVSPPIDALLATIGEERPEVVFARYHELSRQGMPAEYVRAAADAVHAIDGFFVLDVADTRGGSAELTDAGIDAFVGATDPGGDGAMRRILMRVSEPARDAVDGTTSTSFSFAPRDWLATPGTAGIGDLTRATYAGEPPAGRIRVKYIRGLQPMPAPTGWHWHDMTAHYIYVLRGWLTFQFAGVADELTLGCGQGFWQPSGVPHNVVARSDDLEILEVMTPSEYGSWLLAKPPQPWS